jgi:hypothetical protein
VAGENNGDGNIMRSAGARDGYAGGRVAEMMGGEKGCVIGIAVRITVLLLAGGVDDVEGNR